MSELEANEVPASPTPVEGGAADDTTPTLEGVVKPLPPRILVASPRPVESTDASRTGTSSADGEPAAAAAASEDAGSARGADSPTKASSPSTPTPIASKRARPLLRKPATNIRAISTAGSGVQNAYAGVAMPSAVHASQQQQQQRQQQQATAPAAVSAKFGSRRVFPLSPAGSPGIPVEQSVGSSSFAPAPGQAHADPSPPPRAADAVIATAIPANGSPTSPHAVVVGRPSTAARFTAHHSSAAATYRHGHGANSGSLLTNGPRPSHTSVITRVPVRNAPPGAAAGATRRRGLTGSQRNNLITNPATTTAVRPRPAAFRGRETSSSESSESGDDVVPSHRPVTTVMQPGGSPTTAAAGSEPPVVGDLARSAEAYRVDLRPTRQQRLITRNARNPKKIVSCFSTKYPLIRRVAAEMGFEVQETEEAFNAYQFNLCWSDTVLPLTKLVRMGNWQRTNHFPSMYLLSRKGHLGTTLGRLRRKLPMHYAFYPHTWSMRTERALFSRYLAALRQKRLVKYFIMKPNAGCQGRGIVVTRDPLTAIEDPDNYIVQEYVHRPLLLEGKKFDLRVYILLTSIREPSVFMFNDGLVRICSEPYEPPNAENIKDACKHLTNYAVNKHSSNYVFNADVEHMDVGNKRNFRFLNSWLESEGHSAAKFWDEVGFLIVKTILTAQPQICQVYNSCFPRYNEGYTCFEVLGFDVLIDSKLKPWLMEVNHTPSFMTDTPLDLDIKSKLIREVWDIIDCKATDQQRDRLREREDFTKRNMPPWTSNHPFYSHQTVQSGRSNPPAEASPETLGADGSRPANARASYVVSPTAAAIESEASGFAKVVEQRRVNEDSKLKNFSRIYPSSNPDYTLVYETIRNLAQAEWAIPSSTAGFTISGNQYSPGSAMTGISPLTPAQREQQDRIRKDLRDIANGNFGATGPRVSSFPIRHSASPASRAGANGAALSPSVPSTSPPPPSGHPHGRSEEYKRIEDDLRRHRRRVSDQHAAKDAPAPAPSTGDEPSPRSPVAVEDGAARQSEEELPHSLPASPAAPAPPADDNKSSPATPTAAAIAAVPQARSKVTPPPLQPVAAAGGGGPPPPARQRRAHPHARRKRCQ